MSEQLTSCPQCASDDITTYSYQVVCGGCGWALDETDPRFKAHVEALGWAISHVGPVTEAIDVLPADFASALTTSASVLPADHPVHGAYSLTGAEFRMLREAFGLSAEWLADRLGVALKTVQRWENGHRPIPAGVASEMEWIDVAMREGVASQWAEHLLTAHDPVLMIPRTGTLFGFPASWYRALVDLVRELLLTEYDEPGSAAAANFRVVYLDEVEDQS